MKRREFITLVGSAESGHKQEGPRAGRFKMTRDRALLIFMIILMIAPIMAIKVLAAEGSPSDWWFALAVENQREIEQADFEHRTIPNVNAEDRRFIRKMLNELSVSAEAKPTAAQGQWLLAIKEWVKAK